jgi:hypothetical protein
MTTVTTNLNALPMDLLPEGWEFEKLQWGWSGSRKKFYCWIANSGDSQRLAELESSAVGDSPFEAMLNAIRLQEYPHEKAE